MSEAVKTSIGPKVEAQGAHVFELAQRAWSKTQGAKLEIWKAVGWIVVAAIAVRVPGLIIGRYVSSFLALPFSLLEMVVSGVLLVGFMEIGIARASGKPIGTQQLLMHKERWLGIALVFVVQGILTAVGFMLLILPGVYLMVSYLFAPLLAARRGTGVWDSLEASRKQVASHWFFVFMAMLLSMALGTVAALPLGLGLIFFVPWSCVYLGELYLSLFPVEPAGTELEA